jgi:hypothetical protein
MSDFPTKENPKLCKNGCGAKIYLSNETGKYLPYNLDNTLHDCRPKENGKQEFTLEAVLKKLESIGMKIDLDKLMNQR